MKNLSQIFISLVFLFVAASCEKEKDLQKENSPEKNQLKTTETGVCTDETAWAAGARYLTRGNWATFTALPSTLGVTGDDIIPVIPLYAGQNKLAGGVYFYVGPNGTIRIKFRIYTCFHFQDVQEFVKIQGYQQAPLGISPIPGKFTTYKGGVSHQDGEDANLFYVDVPRFNFYGIHLDLLYCCN